MHWRWMLVRLEIIFLIKLENRLKSIKLIYGIYKSHDPNMIMAFRLLGINFHLTGQIFSSFCGIQRDFD